MTMYQLDSLVRATNKQDEPEEGSIADLMALASMRLGSS